VASEQAQEFVFHKLKSLFENSQETLYEIMSTYDFDDSGTILTGDLVRSFKKLGMLHPEPHIPMLLEAGGAHSTSERIDYVTYCQLLEGKIAKQIGLNIKRNHEIVQMIAQSLSTKKMSPFEFFSTLDVNNSARISKLEFKTGMQSLGISMSTSEFNDLWRMIKKPVKKMTQQQLVMEGTEEAKKAKESVAFEDLTYFELLEGFNQAGCFKYA
jgi:Ca2+-binding EF-hand superfamily protein